VLVQRSVEIPDPGTAERVTFAHVGGERRILGLPDSIKKLTGCEPAKADVVIAIGSTRHPDCVVIDTSAEVHRAAQNRAAANAVAKCAIKNAKWNTAACSVN